MDPSYALQRILDSLRDHGALLTRADIEWAFTPGKNIQQIESFIQTYLDTDSMLSLEEKEIYESLKSKDLLSTEAPPLNARAADDKHVSEELAALELENELLKLNISRMKGLKEDHEARLKVEGGYESSLQQNREHLLRSYMSERDQNSAAIDELEATFRACLSDLQDASGKLNFTTSAMSEVTRNDDRLLARLQSMTSDILLASESTGDDLISAATEYADMLATLEEQIIKTRLDHTFLKHVVSANMDEMEGQPYLDAEEFNELIVEVAAVANMRAKEGLLQPILQNLVSDSKSKTGSIAQRCGYILSTLALLDARNTEAEAEITNRNNMQYVSGRMQMLFELSMRDFHDAMQSTIRLGQSKPAPGTQPQQKDEKSYVESRIWRSMGTASLTPGGGMADEITGQVSKLKSKEGLYNQLWATHLKYIQEGSGVVNGMENSVGDIAGGSALTNRELEAVEEKVKSVSAEVGQLAALANARDMPKVAVINDLKNKEMYGK
ncbi:hypothetical protein Dda_1796 [Drechslerella dactyloides]|uniref:Uncharacterized protein n=1 Tax=Drechslerella dactyloides TaxID=74499 RepID=A0AAD6J4P2_DREDA|nr:hypothetical protein Dda_1796 [Drechslerella dactyloides]